MSEQRACEYGGTGENKKIESIIGKHYSIKLLRKIKQLNPLLTCFWVSALQDSS